ncbi:hypothetical protein Ddc_17026 [Ditylenchus destructor]|nr:hypothetical protein Ddc_17026 [Ditylenchus destructor]
MNRCLGCILYALTFLVLYNQAGEVTPNTCFKTAEEKWKSCAVATCTKVVVCAPNQGKLTENTCTDDSGISHDCRSIDCIPRDEPITNWFTCKEPPPVVKVIVKHADQEIPPELEVYSASGKVNGSRFWDRLVEKLLADPHPQIRDLSVKVVAIYTDANQTEKVENSPTEYNIPAVVYLDATTSVKTIDVVMEAKIPVGAFARPNDIFQVFMENAHSYKMKVLRGDGSSVNVDRSKLEPTANMDRIVKKD